MDIHGVKLQQKGLWLGLQQLARGSSNSRTVSHCKARTICVAELKHEAGSQRRLNTRSSMEKPWQRWEHDVTPGSLGTEVTSDKVPAGPQWQNKNTATCALISNNSEGMRGPSFHFYHKLCQINCLKLTHEQAYKTNTLIMHWAQLLLCLVLIFFFLNQHAGVDLQLWWVDVLSLNSSAT